LPGRSRNLLSEKNLFFHVWPCVCLPLCCCFPECFRKFPGHAVYIYVYIYIYVCVHGQTIYSRHSFSLFHNFTHPSAIGHCLVHPLLMIRRGRLSQQLCQRHIIIILQPFLGIASIPQQDSFVVLLYGSCFYNILFTGVLLALLALLVLLTLLVLLVLSASAISSFLC